MTTSSPRHGRVGARRPSAPTARLGPGAGPPQGAGAAPGLGPGGGAATSTRRGVGAAATARDPGQRGRGTRRRADERGPGQASGLVRPLRGFARAASSRRLGRGHPTAREQAVPATEARGAALAARGGPRPRRLGARLPGAGVGAVAAALGALARPRRGHTATRPDARVCNLGGGAQARNHDGGRAASTTHGQAAPAHRRGPQRRGCAPRWAQPQRNNRAVGSAGRQRGLDGADVHPCCPPGTASSTAVHHRNKHTL